MLTVDAAIVLRYQNIGNALQAGRLGDAGRGAIFQAGCAAVTFLERVVETLAVRAEDVGDEAVLAEPEAVASAVHVGQLDFRATEWTFRLSSRRQTEKAFRKNFIKPR